MATLPSPEVTDLSYDLLIAQRFLIEVETHLAERGAVIEEPTVSFVLGSLLTDDKIRARVDSEASHLLGTLQLPRLTSSGTSAERQAFIAERWRATPDHQLQNARAAALQYRERVFGDLGRETVRDRDPAAPFTLTDAEQLAFNTVVQAERPWREAVQGKLAG